MKNKVPYGFIVYLTNHCYLKCKHCIWVQNGRINTEYIEYETMKNVIDIMAKNKVYLVAYTGGDPLIHPDIFKILKYTRERGMLPLLGISGLDITEEIANKIYECGVRCVQVSIDDVNKKYNDYLRGKGCLEKVDKSIDILKAQKIYVNLAVCMNKNNQNNLNEILNYAYKKGIYELKIQFWEKINPKYNIPYLEELSKEEKVDIVNKIKVFEKKIGRENWISIPMIEDEVMPFSRAMIIDTNGDVKHNEHSEAIGNIYSTNMENIFADYFDVDHGII